MGEVFEAVRTGPGGFRRAVALKRLIGDAAIRGPSVQRFLAEARILASLHHPNVIEVYDVIAGDAGYVLVMELLTGATLRGLVRASPLSIDEVCALADQTLIGLEYVHGARGEDGRELGLIHRDVTPNNLFVTADGEVKLLDFGIAKLRAALDAPLTREGEIHGTFELIAPEQARGEPADPRTDLYQLAASVYWALSGCYPHGEGTTVELIARAARVPPTPLSTLLPDLPPALSKAIDRAMALDRSDRFESAAAMRASFASLVPTDGKSRLAAHVAAVRAAEPEVAVEPIVDVAPPMTMETVADAPQARRGARSVQPVRRRRAAIAIAGAIAVAGGGGAWWLVARGTAERSAPSIGVAVPDARAATSAAPLANGRVAFIAGHELVIDLRNGGARRALAIPAELAPIDVEPLAQDRFAVTGQLEDGSYKIVVIDGAGARDLDYSEDRGRASVHPGGTIVARNDTFGVWLKDHDTRSLKTTDHESIVALAWSPDGHQLAIVHDPRRGDWTIDLVDPTTSATTTIRRRALAGDLVAFGWLDARRLGYVVDEPSGAAFYQMPIDTRNETEVGRLPGEIVVGGHVGAGAIAFLHGPSRHDLLLGTREGVSSVGKAIALAGFDANNRAVMARSASEPFGTLATEGWNAWPGAIAGDVPQTVAGSSVIGVRGGDVFRFDATPTRLFASTSPRGTSAVRCAGDAVAPCVAAEATDAWINYVALDPDSGTRGDRIRSMKRAVDFALDRAGKQLAVVDGRQHSVIAIDVATARARWIQVGGGAELDSVAWSGENLIVSARHWRQRPWALLAVDPAGTVHPPLAEARDRVHAEIRASTDALAVATTDVTTALSVLEVP